MMAKEKENQFNVLIVDDERMNIELAAAFLKEMKNIKISFAQNGQQAIKGIYGRNIDLVLLDINMPGIDGFEVCKLLKEDPKTCDIPIIFLTAQNSIEYITKAFEVGGADYINKPFNGEELKARVRTHLKLRATMQELKDKQSRLAQLSITDPLTKVYNLVYLQARLKQAIENGTDFWLVHLHVTSLEKINTLLGHRTAEGILQEVSKIVVDNSYRSDIVARLYGAHFGILVPNRRREELETMLLTLLRNINSSQKLSKNARCLIVANATKPSDTPYAILARSHTTLKRHKNNTDLPFLIEM
ncbi:response regulator [Hydrogenimonas thermophila]|uniref:response regulator n=1 Tax=Hydrogenimonas thermophila TaxID=223786 RepID=UPI002936FAB3|nr:response regulator [Hydrogenimonas thermophila]WOE69206.1 response regulator [Hydrogenimonas thermophila]WOE71716.1 response regulator [Hydrogenimonas thermophila]